MSESHPELDDFDRSLLRAGRADGPGVGAAGRAAAAIGLGVAAAAPAAAAAATAGAAARAVALTGSKWTLIGALGVATVGTGTVAYLGASSSGPNDAREPAAKTESRTAPQPAAAHTGVSTTEGAIPPPPAADLAPARHVPPAPRAQSGAAAPGQPSPARAAAAPTALLPPAANAAPTGAPASPAAAPPGAASSDAVSIAEEVAVVDRARHSLRQGRAGEALDELNRYQSRWPNGTLATEVVVLRVEAELRLGKRAVAKERARAFIASQPSSRYAARLRELFEPGELD
jgi:hypothetical protein